MILKTISAARKSPDSTTGLITFLFIYLFLLTMAVISAVTSISRIYDEEPDRLMIQMEIDGIYRKLSEVQKKKENRIEGNMQAASYFEMVPASIAGETMTTQERECGNPWLCSMIGVLFGAEMCKRRCRHRRCRRWM